MPMRLGHGETHAKSIALESKSRLVPARPMPGDVGTKNSFGYLFDGWTEADRLDPTPETVKNLKALGAVMKDDSTPGGDGPIPAAYTYFGQFVDHDVTLEENSVPIKQLAQADLVPLEGLSGLRNLRTAFTELDSVYFPDVPRDPADGRRLKVGPTVPLNGQEKPAKRPPGKSDLNDLPRAGRSKEDPRLDRAADIGDPRNDENIIVAQLHTAFLKAHNTLVDQGADFDRARRMLVLRYQSALLDDFLGRVCDPDIHASVMANGPTHWKIDRPQDLYMPVEFAFAAYRFGHSMVRTRYNYNLNFEDIGLDTLFSFTALSGQIGREAGPPNGFDTVPDNWIIQWERLVALPASQEVQNARPIDTQLTNFLFQLRDTFGKIEGEGKAAPVAELAPMLAKRNLLRGYLVGLPTGQAMARKLGLHPLEGQALIDALPTAAMKAAAEPFRNKTPLWFYILAEAGNPAQGEPAGRHLGKVGSTILMETFYNLVRHSAISLLDGTDHGAFRPFTLAKLLSLAALQDMKEVVATAASPQEAHIA